MSKETIQQVISTAAGAGSPLYLDFGLPEAPDPDNPGKMKRGRIGTALELVKSLVGKVAKKTNYGQEKLGELGTYLMANLIGFYLTDMKRAHWRYGPDFIFRHDTYQDFWAIVEAKGGTSRLRTSKLKAPSLPNGWDTSVVGYGTSPYQQMGARWIEFWLRHTIDKNGFNSSGTDLEASFNNGDPMLAMVVSLNLDRKQEVKLGMQAFIPEHGGTGFNAWVGF